VLSAQEAERLGMINRVVPHDQLMSECEKTARKLIKIARVGIKYNKAAINQAFENMGFLESIYKNLEFVVLFDTTRTEEQESFNEIRKERGLRAALDWRDERFKDED
jgi:enoyl-CoA hydratase/carnithine racemase